MKAAIWSDIISDYRDERDIDEFIDWCAKIGIDLLLPCVNHGTGYTCYRSSVVPMAKVDEGWDPLGLIVRKAHERGMQVHPWVVIASWGSPLLPHLRGVQYSEVGPPPLQSSHPEYFAVDSYGNSSIDAPSMVYSDGGNCYLDVGKEATQGFLVDLIEELVRKYPHIDGVHLDYIRYQRFRNVLKVDTNEAKEFARIIKEGDSLWLMRKWERNPDICETRFFFKVAGKKSEDGKVKELTLEREYDYCFCGDCLKRFQAETGTDIPAGLNTTEEKSCWILSNEKEKWTRWRASNVTTLVREIRRRLKDLNAGLELSAATFSSYPECIETVGQDWISWINDGLLDFVNPMDYMIAPDKLREIVAGYRKGITDEDFRVYPGIITSPGYAIKASEVKAHIDAIREVGANGVTLFAYSLWNSGFRKMKGLEAIGDYDAELVRSIREPK